MSEYLVSFKCVWSMTVEADSPEDAEEIAAGYCPFDIGGVNIDGVGEVTEIERREG